MCVCIFLAKDVDYVIFINNSLDYSFVLNLVYQLFAAAEASVSLAKIHFLLRSFRPNSGKHITCSKFLLLGHYNETQGKSVEHVNVLKQNKMLSMCQFYPGKWRDAEEEEDDVRHISYSEDIQSRDEH